MSVRPGVRALLQCAVTAGLSCVQPHPAPEWNQWLRSNSQTKLRCMSFQNLSSLTLMEKRHEVKERREGEFMRT